ncbi:MAG: hypothetical protein HQL01_07410 [Nitrospirae bacterium]|nr:hypothetical protein [Nitrospirota bacterium]
MKNLLSTLLILTLFIVTPIPAAFAEPLPSSPFFNEIPAKIAEFKDLYSRQTDKEKIKKAREIDEKSREAFSQGRHELTLRLLNAGIAYLKANTNFDIDALMQAAPPTAPLRGKGTPQYADSPFGILGPYEYWMNSSEVVTKEEINKLLSDVGAKWVQEMPFELKNLSDDINIYTRVGTFPGIAPPNIEYSRYLPLLKNQIASLKGRAKYYEIDTEPLGRFSGWSGAPGKYAEFLKKSYEVIKAECPDCYVVLGGLPGAGVTVSSRDPNSRFLVSILNDNASKYFDVFALKQHFHSLKDYRIIKTRMDVYGKILSDYGVNTGKMPVFLETAVHDGNPQSPMFKLPPQTEAEQAIGVVKTYVYALSIGVTKIYWNGIMELYKFGGSPGDPFNFYALANNKKNDGNSHKKLAYYTYKKMVETLDGSDWKNIKVLKDSDGVFVCRFSKNGKYVWVLWNDNPDTKALTLNAADLTKLKITASVPKASSGVQVSDYSTAFVTSTVATKAGDFTVDAGVVPVYIEEGQ